jgi:hypothetical protein
MKRIHSASTSRASRVFALPAVAALAAAAVVTFAPAARAGATDCKADSDCVKGFTCQTSTATACPDIACAPNEPCNPPPCTPQTFSQCVPAPCSGDSDCATGMVCYEQAVNCVTTEPACPPNAECAEPAAVDASASCGGTTKTCVPRYVPPCSADADCGAGFTCVADQSCACGGSAGGSAGGTGTVVPPTSASAPDEPAVDAGSVPPVSCSCADLSTKHCEMKTIACGAASDCPSMWTCAQPPSATSGCAVAPSEDGAVTKCEPIETTPVQSVCEPPYIDYTGSYGLSAGEATPTAGDVYNGGSGAAPKSASTPSATSDQGGCAMGSGPAGAEGGAWVALLGFAALMRRRWLKA